MVTCEICGGQEFESHAGFFYCTVCQTQSQDFHEQEHDYFENTIVRRKKEPKKKPPRNRHDDGHWTSWEAFNFILYGMTKELEKCNAPEGFQSLVLKFWAFYLKTSNVCFTSFTKEHCPQLRYNFKLRDARVLYNINTDLLTSNKGRRRRRRRSSYTSFTSFNSSNSSLFSESKHAIAKKKRKVITRDYEELVSTSVQSRSSVLNETLESLGNSSKSLNSSEPSLEDEIVKLKKGFSKKDFKTFKKCRTSNDLKLKTKNCFKGNVKSLAKNKLLSILHLALLMLESEIQLSDLLRFIREGHLSFAKVTHFFPHYIKFSKKDFSYIDVVSDHQMPTHLSQRKISGQLARLLKIKRIPAPDMTLLIRRYCYDLNLPEQLEKFSEIIFSKWVPNYFVPKADISFPSYEASAMVSIIFVMKLLFGLNDKTEIFLSELANDYNRGFALISHEHFLGLYAFVKSRTGFEGTFTKDAHGYKCEQKCLETNEWQKFIECRKTILIEHHYPTQEQLEDDVFRSSKQFIHTLKKESKDEFRSERFVSYKSYYMDQNLIKSIKDMLNVLLAPINYDDLEFFPSLTPQTSHLTTIVDYLNENSSESDECKVKYAENILKKSFRDCNIDFSFNPNKYLGLLEKKDSCLSEKLDSILNLSGCQSYSDKSDFEILLNCPAKYWCLHYSETEDSFLSNFKEAILEKTPKNFQWLITECARMLEMNVRDVYNELIKLELMLMPEAAFELSFPKGLQRKKKTKKK